MIKGIRSGMQWGLRLMVAVMLVTGSLGPAFSSLAVAQGHESTLSSFFSFLSAPLVGEQAELVLTVSSTVAAEVSAQIVLPAGIALVEGDLEGRGSVSPGVDWQQAIVVKVEVEGEFKIAAGLEATNEDGTRSTGQAHIYVASAANQATASELEVAVPDEMATVPPQDDGGTVATEGVEVREAPDDLELSVDAERGLVTLGDDTPALPSTGEGIAVLGSVGELVIGQETNQVTLGDDSPDAPEATDGSGNIGSNVDPGVLVIESELAGQGAELTVRAGSGLRTVGDDSPGEPQEIQEPVKDVEVENGGQELALQIKEQAGSIVGIDDSSDEPTVTAAEAEVLARQESGEQVLAGNAQTSLIEPEGEPWAEPLEVATLLPEIEADAGQSELTIESGTDLLVESGDSSRAPRRVAAVNVQVQEAIPEDGWPLAVQEAQDTLSNVSLSPEPPVANEVQDDKNGVSPQAGVDLIVEDIWSTTNPLRAGQWENITFRIKNQGSVSTSNAFYIRMWVGGTVVGQWQATSGLAAGATATGGVSVKVASAGTYMVKVQVDCFNQVAESNEGNNVRTETWLWATGGVDLVVEDIWSTTNPLRAGQWENITYRIRNQGSVSTSSAFYIRMWVDSTVVGQWQAASGLAAGAAATGAVSVKVASAGSHVVKVQVDYFNQVAESNEGNNVRTETWTWAGGGGVDLVVEDIWSTTNPLTPGQWENITYRIKNQGSVSTSNAFYIRMWVGSTVVGQWQAASGLAAGATATGGVSVKVASAGSYVVKVQVDYFNQVAESNEGNNVRTETWTWAGGGVDLVVEDIWSTTNPLTPGQWENITYRIKNQGSSGTSNAFYTRMWIGSTVVGQWQAASGLAAGAAATGAVSVKVASAGSHVVKVQVDYFNQVAESNEGNNVRTETWTWAGAVDLVVEDIWSTTNPLTPGQWENITYRIKNQGLVSTSNAFYIRMWVGSTVVGQWQAASGLAAGATATGAVSVKVASAGSHVVKVQVDYFNQVAESNEGNNVRTETWTWAGAVDLVVEDIWSTTNPLTPGQWENITYRIKNQGSSGTSNAFYTRMWIGSTVVGQWQAASGLAAGAAATGAVSVKVASAGSYVVKVQVDYFNQVAESNEGNNVRTETWTWAGGGGVDLVVEDIWSTTNPLTPGQWENITYRIKNQGSVSTSNAFYTRMWIGSTVVGQWQAASGLAAGAAATGAVSVKVASAGSYVVKVQVDYFNQVAESNEGNNVRTETWTWAGGGRTDSDGDGLLDTWEINGYDHDGNGSIDVNLPAMGADPNKKDIFVEVDWMQDATRNRKPSNAVITRAVAVFANAPTPINLHVDVGQWGGGNALPYDEQLGSLSDGQYQWGEFAALKATHFAEARHPIFHYCIFAHALGDLGSTSGVSRGIPASDFIVSLGLWNGGSPTDDQQLGTFVHELGHNLGLRHGGNDHNVGKPNFLSIMNYHFQTSGLRKNNAWGHFDYSRFNLPALNEAHLNETVGLNGGSAINTYGTYFICDNDHSRGNVINNANGAINWDCDGNGAETDVRAEIDWHRADRSTSIGVVQSYNDWANVVYNGGLIGTTGVAGLRKAMDSLAQETNVQELTEEMDLETRKNIERAALD